MPSCSRWSFACFRKRSIVSWPFLPPSRAGSLAPSSGRYGALKIIVSNFLLLSREENRSDLMKVRGRRSEVRGRRSEVRGRRSEVREAGGRVGIGGGGDGR